MDKGTLGARNEVATKRMVEAASRLGDLFGIEPGYVAALTVSDKDPLVRAMKQREAVADLLEELVKRGEVIQSLAASVEAVEVQEPEPEQEPTAAPVKRGKGK